MAGNIWTIAVRLEMRDGGVGLLCDNNLPMHIALANGIGSHAGCWGDVGPSAAMLPYRRICGRSRRRGVQDMRRRIYCP